MNVKITGNGTGLRVRLLPETSRLYQRYSHGTLGLRIYHITGRRKLGDGIFGTNAIAMSDEQAKFFVETTYFTPEEKIKIEALLFTRNQTEKGLKNEHKQRT